MVNKNNQLRDSRHLEKYFPYVDFFRRPTSADIRHPKTGRIYSRPFFWFVSLKPDGTAPDTGNEGELWYLHDITANVANWVLSEISGGDILTLSDTAGTKTGPDGLGNVQLKSLNPVTATEDIKIVTDEPNNLINFYLEDGPETACANFIVDPAGTKAEYTTIASAIAAASSGDTVFIKPGTYTEDLTLKAGVNITSDGDEDDLNNVTIIGELDASFNGQVMIKNIRFNNDATGRLLNLSDAGSKLVFYNCRLIWVATTASEAILGSAGQLWFFRTTMGGANGVKPFTLSGASFNANYSSVGGNDTVATISSSTLHCTYCTVGTMVTSSGTAIVDYNYATVAPNTAVTAVIDGGTSYLIRNSHITTSSAVALTANGTMTVTNSTINSTNGTAAIDGSGTISYAGLTFSGSQSAITTTTQTILSEGPSRTIGSANIGATNTFTVTNTDNTNTSSHSELDLVSGGASGGDPFVHFDITGAQDYAFGIDNSDSDTLKLTDDVDPSTGTELMTMTAAGAVNFLGPLTVDTPIVVGSGGTGASTLTGILTGNGTSAFTASAVTDNTVVMGSTSNLLQDTTITVTDAGEMVNASQPAFLAVLGTQDSNVTGNGAVFTLGSGNALTEVYDQNGDFNTNGTFTAPVTGRYFFSVSLRLGGVSAAMTYGVMKIATSNRNYGFNEISYGAIITASVASGLVGPQICTFADMDAGDTATTTIQINSGTGDDVDILTNEAFTAFSGALIC